MNHERICPDAYKDAPHYLRSDDSGHWYCPIALDAEREAAYLAAKAERMKLEAWFDLPAAEDKH